MISLFTYRVYWKWRAKVPKE